MLIDIEETILELVDCNNKFNCKECECYLSQFPCDHFNKYSRYLGIREGIELAQQWGCAIERLPEELSINV
jgi:hypothetical protein